jgi:MFS transporter, FSR family, fosmidomycin resistance protein
MPPLLKDPAARRDVRVIGLVSFAHGTSHFFHLLLPPLFPWLMHDFGLGFTQVGALMTIFFVISGTGQAVAGFVVDRLGPRRVLLFGVTSLALSGFALALADSYAMLAVSAALAGLGNSVFHPVDFTILNRRVSLQRLGYAFSAHGLSGNLGWAIAPVFMAGIAALAGWHWAGLGAGLLACGVLAMLIWQRDLLEVEERGRPAVQPSRVEQLDPFAFLRSPGVWLCFSFFFVTTLALGVLQTFSPALLGKVYGLSLAAATSCLTAYMLGGAAGIIAGGVLASRSGSHDRVITGALSLSTLCALILALAIVPAWSVVALMAVLGFGVGSAGPSRDLLVRQTATAGFGKAAFGRVYGFVYSGLDVGFAIAPLVFGPLMDRGYFAAVLGGVALLQGLAIVSAVSVGMQSRVGRRAVSGAG